MRSDASEAAYDWFRDVLGSPRFICAPMVRQSELAFRLLVRSLGCDLAYTPMILAKDVVERYAQTGYDRVATRAAFFATGDRPLIAQIAGNDPKVMAEAARLLAPDVDAVDVNFGCPQQCARLGHYGAFLLDHPDTMVDIVRAIRSAISVPVTCKIRLLNPVSLAIDLAKRLEDAGCSMLAVHGRLRDQRHHCGPVNYEGIAAIKAALRIPVVANGGIRSRDHALQVMEATGCDAVMSATTLLRQPAMFAGDPVSVFDCLWRYARLARTHPPIADVSARDHVLTVFRERFHAEGHLDLVGILSNKAIRTANQIGAVLAIIAHRFQEPIDEGFPGSAGEPLPSFNDICNNRRLGNESSRSSSDDDENDAGYNVFD
ncbi:unnamed protein product (mitochondrion) [Plasmodiophora brassicae]|uniref:tRNA-dihydrouridine(16/17) synthase [NAD(P)(+)] n=1 Tax=Plasmodiophora brassicae TaxID=37360 RepID=A0A0G4INU6_PLABS|nr:hypothetical protein PBRA_005444 [Plasmodiophora brassicae]SPR01799.1 unnamed protein product [Plasmodiophora brassicae]